VELEIFEGDGWPVRAAETRPGFANEGTCAWMFGSYQAGARFRDPEDPGVRCPWLVDSLMRMIRVIENGLTLPWTYRGTPYEKVIDPDGVTTEFVRCPDPTASGIVIKVTRTASLE